MINCKLNTSSFVLVQYKLCIATFVMHFLDHRTYEICKTAAEICSESVKNYEYVFPCELNALCHLWDRHHLQLRGHTH